MLDNCSLSRLSLPSFSSPSFPSPLPLTLHTLRYLQQANHQATIEPYCLPSWLRTKILRRRQTYRAMSSSQHLPQTPTVQQRAVLQQTNSDTLELADLPSTSDARPLASHDVTPCVLSDPFSDKQTVCSDTTVPVTTSPLRTKTREARDHPGYWASRWDRIACCSFYLVIVAVASLAGTVGIRGAHDYAIISSVIIQCLSTGVSIILTLTESSYVVRGWDLASSILEFGAMVSIILRIVVAVILLCTPTAKNNSLETLKSELPCVPRISNPSLTTTRLLSLCNPRHVYHLSRHRITRFSITNWLAISGAASLADHHTQPSARGKGENAVVRTPHRERFGILKGRPGEKHVAGNKYEYASRNVSFVLLGGSVSSR